MGILTYLDLTNANRIGLSVHDPLAIFSFACLCLVLVLAIFLLTWTARRSAEDVWNSAHLVRGTNYHDPAYKRQRKSVWSLSSQGSSSGGSGSGSGSVAAPMLPCSASSSSSPSASSPSRMEFSLSLIANAEVLGGGAEREEPELMFSPQAVSGRFLDSQQIIALLSNSTDRLPLHSSVPRLPEPAELPAEMV
ncbi:hypothetical protein B0A55_00403 [Friedmanniomyces simplex]|uniref:Uncharacterized protein n=1 Tax=Friedmanniomyces simplex TaxID=329884 RepID=A0A4U0Y5S1_9PEZI|nr:hypothetical protein B0A55_00403 [Friedmanniomyces simplex]